MHPENLTLADVSSIADEAICIVGLKLLAAACATEDLKTVCSWVSGDAHPNDDGMERLLAVKETLDIVCGSAPRHEVRLWFRRPSCDNDNSMSPAFAIRSCNFDDALASARRFADKA